MKLDDFKFPVIERPVAVFNGHNEFTDWDNDSTYLDGDYKAIVREDTNELISIVRRSYKIVPNEVLIDQLLQELSRIDTPYHIDKSHSFVSNNRMRLQVTFPDITMQDDDSDIALSLFMHNSYDTSEGIRMFWGAIRGICTNGMVFGKVLAKFYHRHTSGFQMHNLRNTLTQTYDAIPFIQSRIKQLEEMEVTEAVQMQVSKELGKTIASQVITSQMQSQWELYNAITYIISHAIEQRHRARYQMACAKVFSL